MARHIALVAGAEMAVCSTQAVYMEAPIRAPAGTCAARGKAARTGLAVLVPARTITLGLVSSTIVAKSSVACSILPRRVMNNVPDGLVSVRREKVVRRCALGQRTSSGCGADQIFVHGGDVHHYLRSVGHGECL